MAVGVIVIKGSPTENETTKIRNSLIKGKPVIMFPERYITKNGQMSQFFNDFEVVMKDLTVPILPFYIRGLWGTPLSLASDKFMKNIRYSTLRDISVVFGELLPHDSSSVRIKQVLRMLSIYAWQDYSKQLSAIPLEWLKVARRHWSDLASIDISGESYTVRKLFTAAIMFSRIIKKTVSVPKAT